MRSAVVRTVLAVAVGALGTARGAQVRADPIPVAEDAPAVVARVVCEEDGVLLETPVVRARRDGVHFALQNPGAAWGYEIRGETWEPGVAVGGDFRGETAADETFSLGPGRVVVACLPTGTADISDPGVATAALTIVDPEGLYLPSDLVCGFGDQSRTEIAASEDEDPAGVLRRLPGIRPSDELRKPGYPDSPQMWPTFLVFRDKVAIARITGPRIGEAWRLIVNDCPGGRVV